MTKAINLLKGLRVEYPASEVLGTVFDVEFLKQVLLRHQDQQFVVGRKEGAAKLRDVP